VIATIHERITNSRVSKCMASKPHYSTGGRLICEMFHNTRPKYRTSYFIFDMFLKMISKPHKARQYWHEMITILRDKD
jgi:hypothetical protein